MRTKTIIFLGIVTVLIILMRSVFAVMPQYIQDEAIPIVWTIWIFFASGIGGLFLIIGPSVLANYAKKWFKWINAHLDPGHQFTKFQWFVINLLAALIIGSAWIYLPELLVVHGGWYYKITQDPSFGHFQYETAHIFSAVYAFVLAVVTFIDWD